VAALEKQGIVKIWRHRGPKFWAWVISLLVHLAILTTFGVVKFSKSHTPQSAMAVPSARVIQASALMEPTIMPKPKIKKELPQQVVKEPEPEFSIEGIFDNSLLLSDDEGIARPPETAELTEDIAETPAEAPPVEVEFFGSRTDRRKVCYVVDCSGSMWGLFGRVRRELKASIDALEADQFFSIIFFGGDRILEFADNSVVRATDEAKALAADFIDSVRPGGETDALAALERAAKIRDSAGQGPSVIYFLTDGFDLAVQDQYVFSLKVAGLLKRFAPQTRMHTIGFWSQDDDRRMLEIIAKQSGGEFVLVGDEEN